MSKRVIFLLLALSCGVVVAYAKRLAPKDVPPVTFQGVKYTAPHFGILNGRKQNGGYIEATGLETDNVLWDLKVYTLDYDKNTEGDIQDIFITSLKIVDGNLEILNEVKDTFVVDLKARKVIKGTNCVYRDKVRER